MSVEILAPIDPDFIYEKHNIPLDEIAFLGEDGIDAIPLISTWNSHHFAEAMIILTRIGEGKHLPAERVPKVLDLGVYGLEFSSLRDLGAKSGVEYSYSILVDVGSEDIFISPIVEGTEKYVDLNRTTYPGRENSQVVIGGYHVHVGSKAYPWFSPIDYKTFLEDPNQQFMVVVSGENEGRLVMKTNFTPNLPSDRVVSRLKGALSGFTDGDITEEDVRMFNIEVCTQFGLVMFDEDPSTTGVFVKKDNVTEISEQDYIEGEWKSVT